MKRYDAICGEYITDIGNDSPWTRGGRWPIGEMIGAFRPIVQESMKAQIKHMNLSTYLVPPGHLGYRDDITNELDSSIVDTPDLSKELSAEEVRKLPEYPDVIIQYRYVYIVYLNIHITYSN